MNEARSNESCRKVSCSPGPPSRTSWCATKAAEPNAVHADSVHLAATGAREPTLVVASGLGSTPAEARSAAISWAVRTAVPEGASTCPGGGVR